MFRIVEAEFLAPDIKRFVIEAPRIARKRQAGQFVIVRVSRARRADPADDRRRRPRARHDHADRPGDRQDDQADEPARTRRRPARPGRPAGQAVRGQALRHGRGHRRRRRRGDRLPDRQGHARGRQPRDLHPGGRTRDLVILEPEIRAISDEVFVTTDDGSYGRKGLVIDPLKELIAAGRPIDHVLAIGPLRMMQAVAEVTRPHQIPTIVSLNPLMVDGTGMCGGCRIITTGGRVRLRRRPRVRRPRGGLQHPRPAQPDLRRPRGGGAAGVPRASRGVPATEARESCRLEAAHPEVRHSEERVS